MNERIQQLAEQATAKISFRLDPNTYKHIDDPDGDLERFEFDKQKFAELIVEECAKRAEVYAYMSPNFNALAEELRSMIGVEE